MQRIRGSFLVILLSLLILISSSQGVTVLVNVYEKEVNITPLSGASVYANSALVGKTDGSGNIEFSHPGTDIISVRVSKLGYDEWNGDIGVNTSTLLVQLLRKSLLLTTQVYDADTLAPVPGARLSLSGEWGKNTTVTNANGTSEFVVEAESVYNLGIQAENYHSRDAVVEMGLDAKTVQYMLMRDDRFSLLVKDEESGQPIPDAGIFVDGTGRGSTDSKGLLTLQLPREKVYQVKIEKEGYEDYNERRIVGKEDAFVTILLSKSPYSLFISVYNEDQDPVEGAEVFVGDVKAGETSRFGRILIGNLTYGNYTLAVKHPGYSPARKSFSVTRMGDEITIELEFFKVNLTVNTEEGGSTPVPDVTIRLNGNKVGETDEEGALPVRLRLDVPYTISAEKEGYNPASVQREVRSVNETTPIRISMERSMNWALVGGILVVIVVAIALAILLLRRKGGSRPHGRKGGL
ncbi:MAG: hypothetical protein LUQ01_04375 [Methanolinea sp.]|nr:hypothetical protein [Methanolinea sp.]